MNKNVFAGVLMLLAAATFANGLQCPRCSNPYDIASCIFTITCNDANHDICELQVNTGDLNRLEFKCFNVHACHNHEMSPCDPSSHEICSFCCNDVDDCRNFLGLLFDPSAGGIFTTPNPGVTPATTTLPTTTTTPPTTTTTIPTTTTTTTTTPHPLLGFCMECGDYSNDVGCTGAELVSPDYVRCPALLPYCFASTIRHEGELYIVKGCGDPNFCRAEWYYTDPDPQCHALPVIDHNSTTEMRCTWCCDGPVCNEPLKPEESTIITFPDK